MMPSQDFKEAERTLVKDELSKPHPRHIVDIMEDIFWLSEEIVQ